MSDRPADLSAPTAAIIQAVHDGDTITALVNTQTKAMLGYNLWAELPLRLAGCNARELTQPGGIEARDHLAGLLPVGTTVTVVVVRADKYDPRRLATVSLPDGTDLAATLIAGNWAATWTGAGIKPVPPWPRP